jgi:putative ABC transport system permease protein
MQPALALSGNTFRAQTPNGNPVPLFSRIRNMNLSLGISMLLSRKKSFFSFFLVFVFLSFVAIVPMNLSHTIEDPGFMRYMGMGPCDIVIRLQQSEEMEDRLKDMENLVSSDPDVDSYSILSTGTYTVLSTDGSTEHLKIETGDHSIFPVAYLEGSLPREVNEVALSKLNADEMGRSVGDTLFLINADGSRITLKVCGVYSDITNGGKTAKAAYIESVSHIMWTVMSVSLKSGAGSEAKAATWQAAYSGVKVIDSRQYFSQTLGSTVYNLKMASIIAASVSVLITALSVSLFLRLLLAKDRYEIAILKSLGFRHRDIKTQYTLCFGAVATTGVGVGALLACTLGKEASGLILTGLGIFDFTFVIDKFNAFLFLPLSIILVTVCTSVLRAESLKRVTVADGIKE